MRVLFVRSGNYGVDPISQNQGISLINEGLSIEYYDIIGKGLIGYIKNIYPLRKYIKGNKFDLIHAHYSLSAFVASLAGAKPIVVSLMGSDVKVSSLYRGVIKIFSMVFWSSTIVKSNDMKRALKIRKVHILPNGVNFDVFQPMDRNHCKEKLGWDISKKQILFAANPSRYEKNYNLAKESVESIKREDIELKVLINIPNHLMPFYHNAADVVLLTSLWEGSPNVIKEAMACNTPIVSTDVGDVNEVIGSTKGCYVSSYEPSDVAKKIKMAFEFNNKTDGRKKIKHLDSEIIAKKILNIYKEVIDEEM